MPNKQQVEKIINEALAIEAEAAIDANVLELYEKATAQGNEIAIDYLRRNRYLY